MIVVAGESLVDLFVDSSGHVAASLGGAAFNTARTIARLGRPVVYIGRLSTDRFGRLLGDSLAADGVRLGAPEPVVAPTTLATVDVDPAGVPSYRFYLTNTSAAALDDAGIAAAMPADPAAVHIGSLALVAEPVGGATERLVTRLPETTLLMVDPNCRPTAVSDRAAYLERMRAVLRRADVVKVSVEDLGYLLPDAPPQRAVRTILAAGPRVVLVTDGAAPARAVGAAGDCSAAVPPVEVVDTVGAGDAFGGAFLAWWTGNGLGRDDLADTHAVRAALRASVQVSALTCGRVGADPPTTADLAGVPGWTWPAGER